MDACHPFPRDLIGFRDRRTLHGPLAGQNGVIHREKKSAAHKPMASVQIEDIASKTICLARIPGFNPHVVIFQNYQIEDTKTQQG